METWLNLIVEWSWLVYLFVFVVMFVESIGAPLPGLSIVLVAAALAGQGKLEIWLVVLANLSGAWLGGQVGYWLGFKGGRPILEKYGRYVLLTPDRIITGDQILQKHGLKAILFSRYLPVLCFLGGFLAGIARLPYRPFTLFNFLGIALWSATQMTLAYIFGRNIDVLLGFFNRLGLGAGVIVLVLGVGYYLLKSHQKRKKANAIRQESSSLD